MTENQTNQIITENQKNLKNIKILGGIGSILVLLAFFPEIGPLLWLAGCVFLIIAIHKISKITGERKIFINYIAAFVLNIITGLLVIGLIIGGVISIFLGPFSELEKGESVILKNLEKENIEKNVEDGKEKIKDIIKTFVIGGILLTWILMILSGYFTKKSFNGIFEVTGENCFQTAGKCYFWGAILAIILIGLFIQLIANILTIVAFFSLPDKLEVR